MATTATAARTLEEAAALTADQVLLALGSGRSGLSPAEAARRLGSVGPNAVRTHRARFWAILGHQFRSALLLLLGVTALVAYLVGSRSEAVIIGVILLASVCLGFFNEYRAERVAQTLHASISHLTTAIRGGEPVRVDVVELVPGDVVLLGLGVVVPADLRLLTADGLSCDESMLTGESLPVVKGAEPVALGAGFADLNSCALMGTVVTEGLGSGVVVATGRRTAFGSLALALGERAPETDFQIGLRAFSRLLLQVAVALSVLILVANLLLARPLIDALLFSLAIAVGITPQLLPAIVSTSLAAGSRLLAQRRVLVKRLICIEDLGDMDLLVTDKTGTLTEGRVTFAAALDPLGAPTSGLVELGLQATSGARVDEHGALVGANELDLALWRARPEGWSAREPLAELPFDHRRRLSSALVTDAAGNRTLVVKGSPEAVLSRCHRPPSGAGQVVERLAGLGNRVVAVATRQADAKEAQLSPASETELNLRGFLTFLDPAKDDAAASLRRLSGLGVKVKIATGDHPLVAERVCAELGLESGGTLVGAEVDAMVDADLAGAAERCTVFARVSPEQKARIVTLLRREGRAVGFLGDGVNDALALHAADIGISVDGGADVAKDAADVVLLEKDLGVLANGITEGRRVFANTIKYVLMGTSSNFGNMFSAAAASAVLPFLPMLPDQILLNNLLYDTGQLTIPTDLVDADQLRAPSHWDLAFIRRFMLFFGPLSSLFDFLTFAVMLGVFQAAPAEFRSGWFVESLATQTLVILVIRTRRTPFWRSKPSRPLAISLGLVVLLGVAIPFSPFAAALGFAPLPPVFFLALLGMVAAYLSLVEGAKRMFFNGHVGGGGRRRARVRSDRVHRRAAKFSHGARLPR